MVEPAEGRLPPLVMHAAESSLTRADDRVKAGAPAHAGRRASLCVQLAGPAAPSPVFLRGMIDGVQHDALAQVTLWLQRLARSLGPHGRILRRNDIID